MLITDYQRFRLHAVELQTTVRTHDRLSGIGSTSRLATLCTDHCMTCEALPIRAMRLDVIPTFLRFVTGSLIKVPN